MDRKWLSFMVVLIVFVGSLAFYQISSIPLPFKYEQAEVVSKDNPLDGCYHVYLDVGTNIGIQVTTLRRNSRVIQIFDSYSVSWHQVKKNMLEMPYLCQT